MIYVGLESASDRVMGACKKNNNQTWRVEEILQIASRNDIGINLNLLVGLPEDDEESLNETYEFIKKYPYVTTAGFFCPIPGTSIIQGIKNSGLPLENNADLDGYLKNFSNRWVDGVHLPTKYLSKDRVVYWKQKFDELIKGQGIPFRHFLDPKEVSRRIAQRFGRNDHRS